MSYDLRKIEEQNEWVLDILDEEEILSLPEINKLLQTKTGTLVIWQEFDKIEESAKTFRDSFISTIGNAKNILN